MHDVYKDIQTGYNKIKNSIDVGKYHYDFLSKKVAELIVKIKYDEIRLLDAGCGNGYLLRDIHKQNLDSSGEETVSINYYGFDISNDMVSESIKINPEMDHRILSLPETDYEENFFDVIVMGEVLEHLYQPKASLMELRRILKDDGELVITVPNGDRIGIDKVISYKKKFQPADDVLLTYPELNHLFRVAGFRIVVLKGYGGVFPILSKYSRLKKYFLLTLGLFYKKLHPDINRMQKQFFFVLKKDDYLLGTDY